MLYYVIKLLDNDKISISLKQQKHDGYQDP